MFFVLSGYVLAYNHLDGRKLATRKFWTARAARVLPAFIAGEILTSWGIFALLHHDHAATVRNVAFALGKEFGIAFTFLQAWVFPGSANPPSWSLSCEFFFYLLFPVFAGPITSLRRPALIGVSCFLAAATLVGPMIYLAWGHPGIPISSLTTEALWFPGVGETNRALVWGQKYVFFLCCPIFHLPNFLLGAALGRYRRAFMTDATLRKRTRETCFVLVTIVILILLTVGAKIPHLLLNVSVIGPVFALALLYSESAPEILIRLLKNRPMLILGEASYAMYILQAPFAAIFGSLVHILAHTRLGSSLGQTIACVVLLIAFCIVFYKWVEQPVRLHFRRFAYGGTPV